MASRREFGPVQLSRWLGMRYGDFQRACMLTLVPPPDVRGTHWSEALAKTLPDRVEEIQAELAERTAPDGGADNAQDGPDRPRGRPLGPVQLARFIGLERWQMERAVDRGLVPGPDTEDGKWSRRAADALRDRVADLRAAVGDHPGHGSVRAAEVLAERTGLDVRRDDVLDLRERGLLAPAGAFRGHPMFARGDLDALPRDAVARAVAEREAWLAASLTPEEAAREAGWSVGRFEVAAERAGLEPGRYGRFARADVAPLLPPAS
ncbi:hypothetical protein [Nocardiopsis suaedae]|uniref:Uncharacterized protein n=1 Tax=Nocardiopsis suaedae TaxID=3018444 RepID=A0ABT4TF00_9ACTN|nr:hypothetical protein [Nocardiopsis suaedae]MDA2803278.1 hypothetical protein [Nocardiopsis suaedae]